MQFVKQNYNEFLDYDESNEQRLQEVLRVSTTQFRVDGDLKCQLAKSTLLENLCIYTPKGRSPYTLKTLPLRYI